jgi:hypothetical protein
MDRRSLSIAAACAAAVGALGLVLLAAGCGDDDGPTGPDSGAPPDTYVVASDAFFATERMFQTYAAQDVYWYDRTLARNYRFIFANADPTLQAVWDSSWTITVEDTTARHVFDGFDFAGTWRPGADRIETIFGGLQLGIDPAHQDSTNHYQRVRVLGYELHVVLPDGTTYQVVLDLNVYVVRGDVAILGSGQPADSRRWYVRRVVENAEPPAPPRSGADRTSADAVPITWGGLRGLYSYPRALEVDAR